LLESEFQTIFYKVIFLNSKRIIYLNQNSISFMQANLIAMFITIYSKISFYLENLFYYWVGTLLEILEEYRNLFELV
jgi:hypothetical protein